jgi:hypothetical protein
MNAKFLQINKVDRRQQRRGVGAYKSRLINRNRVNLLLLLIEVAFAWIVPAQAKDLPLSTTVLDTPETLHECFRAEERDDEWAPAAETQILDFIAKQPYGDTFEVSSVECRTTICELHASLRAPIETTGESANLQAAWQSLVDDMRYDGAIGSEFDEQGIVHRAKYGERAEYTTTLVRRSSIDFSEEARCGGLEESILRSQALGTMVSLSEDVRSSFFKLNAYFEGEQRDERWAPVIEGSIREFIARQSFGQAFSVSSIECRETLCQIRASADAVAASEASSQRSGWNEALVAVHDSLGLELEHVANRVSIDQRNPGRIVYIATVQRKR